MPDRRKNHRNNNNWTTALMNKDAVDGITSQWQVEKPQMQTNAMETLGRLKRCSVLYQPLLDTHFAKYGLNSWEFDVLATLRRAGEPYQLLPTQLFTSLMVTSGTMTHRLKTLTTKGLIQRVASNGDARQKAVQLTQEGLELIDRALVTHVDNLEAILSALTDQERSTLNQSLKKLLNIFENKHSENTSLSNQLNDKTHRL